jgi:hypothetical protein
MALNHFILNPTTGSFRSIDALNNYLQQLLNEISNSTTENNSQGITVELQGVNTISSTISLTYSSLVRFVGNGGTLIVNDTLTLSNVSFENCQIVVNIANGFNLLNNCQFINCTITYAHSETDGVGGFVAAQQGNFTNGCFLSTTSTSSPTNPSITNITFDQCIFTTANINYFPFIVFQITNEAHYLEHIRITNNKFNNTSGSEDQRGVVGIISTITTVPTLAEGPRIVDIAINNNICNKSQLISISATLNGGTVVNNMLVPISVSISNNTCGAISYLAKQDLTSSAVNSGKVFNQENGIRISGNTCKLIYCGFSNGFINVSGDATRAIPKIVSGSGVYSASTYITSNVCSWIQVGIRSSTSYAANMPILKIKDNKLNAFLATFLSAYYNGVSAANIGLIEDSVIGT